MSADEFVDIYKEAKKVLTTANKILSKFEAALVDLVRHTCCDL